MAIYHLSAKIMSRSAGRSAVAAAAYRSGATLCDERQGTTYDYSRKGGVVHSEIVAPDNAPDWMCDRSQLWNAVERVEKRRDAQLAREIEVALPRELPLDRQVELVRGFVGEEFVARGMIADVSVHHGRARDGGEQPHAHIMLTMRELTGEGFGPKNREWNGTDRLEGWRARWAAHVNAELERTGCEERVDHRSLQVQRAAAERDAKRAREAGDDQAAERHEIRAASLDREPDPKIGPHASQLEAQGIASHRGDERRAVEERNAERSRLYEQVRELAREIAETARAVAAEARRRIEQVGRRLEAAFAVVRQREEQRASTIPVPEPPARAAADIAKVTRDAILGRAAPSAVPRERTADRDVLLGRAAGASATGQSTADRGEGAER